MCNYTDKNELKNINVLDVKNRQDIEITLYDFLSAFKKKNDTLVVRAYPDNVLSNETAWSRKYNFTQKEVSDAERKFKQWNYFGKAITFVVNNGGGEAETINELSAHFCDIDFWKFYTGKRDENNKLVTFYRSDEEIEQLKQINLPIIMERRPSIVVETKNGFHVHWLLIHDKVENHIKRYTPIQKEMCKFFNRVLLSTDERNQFADEGSCDLAHGSRAPGYYHKKNVNSPFLVKCIYFKPSLRYKQDDILQIFHINVDQIEAVNLNDLEQLNIIESLDDGSPNEGITNKVKNAPRRVNENSTETINVKASIRKNDKLIVMNNKKKNQIIFDNGEEFFDFFRHQNLYNYLGIPQRNVFRCLFHDDNHPSAYIKYDSKYGYRYYCRSNKCQLKHGDIFDVTKIKENYNDKEVMKHLCKEYNVKLIDGNWISEHVNKYQNNLTLLQDKDKLSSYINLYNKFKNATMILYLLNSYGMEQVRLRGELCRVEGKAVFFLSFSKMEELLQAQYAVKKSVSTINRYVNLMCYLGIINKVPIEDLPDVLREDAIELTKKRKEDISIERGRYVEINEPCFYSIPLLASVLSIAEQNAKKLKRLRVGMRIFDNFTLTLVTGDQEEADKIIKNKNPYSTERKQEINDSFINALINNINKRGYADVNTIYKLRVKGFDRNKKKTEFDRAVSKLLDMGGYKYEKVNKSLKEKLKLRTYSYIITRAEESTQRHV